MKEIEVEEQKQIQLDILYDVATFCEENGLQYFLAYGTLIGAIRHHGYIPWDDDIDIWMPEPDYDRFLETYHSGKYKVIHNGNTKNYFVNFAKVHDERTRYQESYTRDTGYGIFIDVFPLHAYGGTWQRELCYLFYRIIRMKRALWYKGKPFYKNLINYIGKIFLLPLPLSFIAKCLEKSSRLMKWERAKNVHSFSGNASDYPKECFFNYKIVSFETLMVHIPMGFHQILALQYGDYMKLPPVKDRVAHHDAIVGWK